MERGSSHLSYLLARSRCRCACGFRMQRRTNVSVWRRTIREPAHGRAGYCKQGFRPFRNKRGNRRIRQRKPRDRKEDGGSSAQEEQLLLAIGEVVHLDTQTLAETLRCAKRHSHHLGWVVQLGARDGDHRIAVRFKRASLARVASELPRAKMKARIVLDDKLGRRPAQIAYEIGNVGQKTRPLARIDAAIEHRPVEAEPAQPDGKREPHRQIGFTRRRRPILHVPEGADSRRGSPQPRILLCIAPEGTNRRQRKALDKPRLRRVA